MPSRELPARPHLDHLKREAKALRDAFAAGDADAAGRAEAVLGARTTLKLTEAQRVIAREYGFASWARLRTHVDASRDLSDAVDAFLAALQHGSRERALGVLEAQPAIATTSVHVAAALGREDDVRRLLEVDPASVSARRGPLGGEPLLWLCYSPFHGESPERDEALARSARALLAAGADPNTTDTRHGVPALYAVTGVHNAPRVARILLEAGANPNDGESAFHAAERFHVEALELLLEHGADLNRTGEWGNTPLYFLLRYWKVAEMADVRRGMLWLLDHGADPDVRCGRERESSLHVAVRRGQNAEVVSLLLERGADVHARRGDGRTPWVLARRGGFAELEEVLARAGARSEPLSPADELLAACGRGDPEAARALATAELVGRLAPDDRLLITEAAADGRAAVVRACLAAGIPVDTVDEQGATALHHAAIHGRAALAGELLAHGADLGIRDAEHASAPLGWACFGVDYVRDAAGDYVATVKALLDAGARPSPDDRAAHAGVRELLEAYR